MKKKFIAAFLVALVGMTSAGIQSAYASAGWQNNDGVYSYNNTDGSKKIGWYNPEPSVWYYFDKDGKMVTGQYEVEKGKHYYFDESNEYLGTLYKGWKQIGNDWYFFNTSNDQGGLGLRHTGWLNNTTSDWYYFNEDGKMVKGLCKIGQNTYYFYESEDYLGAMYKGWKQVNNDWYYFDSSNSEGSLGAMHKGWLKTQSGTWYYFQDSGIMVTGGVKINGVNYSFGSDGALIR